MFQFRRFPTYTYLIQCTLTGSSPAGLPHSEISGSKLICSSPKLIAAYHVFRRLLMPRHSPCALNSLTASSRTPYPSLLPFGEKLAHSVAPPFIAEPASLGFVAVRGRNLDVFRPQQLGSTFLRFDLVLVLIIKSISNYAGSRFGVIL